MQTDRVADGKRISLKADIYYNATEGKMLMHYTYPSDYYFISNRLGEAKIYYPDKNEVMLKQQDMFSTDNSLLFYFICNKGNDFGLKELGFHIGETRFEEDVLVTSWLPPVELINQISKIEMVYDDYAPIYSAYFDKNEQITKKIFYSDYTVFDFFTLPMRVTELNYTPQGDSTITRIIYSNVNTNITDNSFFDFKVPDDAKILK